MKILFTTIKSPYTSDFKSLLTQVRLQAKSAEIGLLLLQDAVHAAYPTPKNPLTEEDTSSIKVYAGKEDLKARGIAKSKVHSNTKIVDTSEVIDLVMDEYDKMVSWS